MKRQVQHMIVPAEQERMTVAMEQHHGPSNSKHAFRNRLNQIPHEIENHWALIPILPGHFLQDLIP